MIKDIQYWNHMHDYIMNMVPELQNKLLGKKFKFMYYDLEFEGKVIKLWFNPDFNQLWVRLHVEENNNRYNLKASTLYE